MDVQKDFSFLRQGIIYLDSAATCHKPASVIDVLKTFYEEEYATVHRAAYPAALAATGRYSLVRENIARFIGAAHSEEIVFTKGTTEALNLVASSYGGQVLTPGDEVIISHTEHHANLIPWQRITKETGACLRYISVDNRGVLELDVLERMLGPRTKIVSLAHTSNVTGVCHPIAEIARVVRHLSPAAICIDGAQAVGHVPVHVQEMDIDFFAFSSHKCYGPTGLGVLYGKSALLNAMPPYQTGGDMIDIVTLQDASYQRAPLRFEAGTPPIAQVIGLGAAIDYIETLGRDSISAWETQLLSYATKALKEVPGLHIVGDAPFKGPIISFYIDGVHPLDIGTLLGARDIYVRTGHLCAQPAMSRFGVTALVRVSFAVYNSFRDIDLFLHHLNEVIAILR